MKTKLLLLLFLANFSIYGQYTAIPDANFENKLISLGIDSGVPDGKVLTANVVSLTSLDLENRLISDLTGIESFTSLTYLSCKTNKLTKIDLSQNTKLTKLDISDNQLTNLDVTKNILLQDLNCQVNKITNLSLLTNTNLLYLNIIANQLSSLDISKNTLLRELSVIQNKLTNLNIDNNPALTALYCGENSLNRLDVSKNTLLIKLLCYKNQITSLDVSKNIELINLDIFNNNISTLSFYNNLFLRELECSNNQLTSIDLSSNNMLTSLSCTNNKLTYLNLKNGNNTKLEIQRSNFKKNPDLTCIQVDDIAYANKNWTITKDSNASFSTDCTAYTLIPDTNFEKKLIALGIDNDGVNGRVLTSNITSVTTLNISNSSISDMTGIQNFASLTSLDCSGNQITALNLSKNVNLANLNCDKNKLTALDVSNNLVLQTFSCQNNQLTLINISKNLALTSLYVSTNKLTNLDVSSYLGLTTLNCDHNVLTRLDVSKNILLKQLYSASNQLTCILVHDVDYAYANWDNQKDITASYTKDCNATTAIPDLNFENKLISLGIDSGTPDGKVLTTNIASLTSLDITNSSIKDLTGIEAFRELTVLYANKNQITTLDLSSNKNLISISLRENKLKDINIHSNFLLRSISVSKNELTTLDLSQNTKLTDISAEYNNLTILDVSKNILLNNLFVSNNQLTSLDLSKNTILTNVQCIFNKLQSLNIKNATFLTSVNCGNNQLTTLDVTDSVLLRDLTCEKNLITSLNVTNNTALEFLYCSSNKLTSLDVIKNIKMGVLYCDMNQLTDLNVSKNTLLTQLYVYNNSLITIDVSKNTELNIFYCYSNLLTSVDISNNTKITHLQVDINKLTSLNLKNGNNAIFDSKYTNFNNNPNLTCIIVDDVAYSNTNWSNLKDKTASYSTDCSSEFVQITDSKFEQKLIDLGIDTDGLNGRVNKLGLNKITSLDLSNSNISNITGIEAFTGLTNLDLNTNNLQSININQNILLQKLSLNDNKLTSLDSSNNLLLTSIKASNNQFTTIDVVKNTALTYLAVSNNQLTAINVSKNIALKTLDVSGNKIETLDVSKNPALNSLTVTNNQLTSLNLKNGKNNLLTDNNVSFTSNSKLTCILVDDVNYANANWSNLKDIFATYNTECTGELTLPVNNFTIETKGESCIGENNGEITIVAKTAFAYTATVNDKSYTFTNNSLKVASLAPGVYKIKITIPDTIFEQNFNVTIAKGSTITGKSSITSKKVDLEITEGTAPFTVFLDRNQQFQTTDTNFSIELSEGGLLEVETSKACEGVYAKKIKTADILGTILSTFPNPTKGIFEIEVPTTKNEVIIAIYNFSGQLISSKNYVIENGTAKLSLENQPSGIYAVKIYLETPEFIKIIKK